MATTDRVVVGQLHVQSQEEGRNYWWDFLSKHLLDSYDFYIVLNVIISPQKCAKDDDN